MCIRDRPTPFGAFVSSAFLWKPTRSPLGTSRTARFVIRFGTSAKHRADPFFGSFRDQLRGLPRARAGRALNA
eukprot:2039332-Alexandrium_andersonii.AAC.1